MARFEPDPEANIHPDVDVVEQHSELGSRAIETAGSYKGTNKPDAESEEFEEDVILLDTDVKKPGSNAKVLVTRLNGFDLHESSVHRVLTESRLNCEVVNCYIEYVVIETLSFNI